MKTEEIDIVLAWVDCMARKEKGTYETAGIIRQK